MIGTTALDGLSEDDLLDFAELCADTVTDAEVGLLRVASTPTSRPDSTPPEHPSHA